MLVLVKINMDGYVSIEEEEAAVREYIEDMDSSAINIKVVGVVK